MGWVPTGSLVSISIHTLCVSVGHGLGSWLLATLDNWTCWDLDAYQMFPSACINLGDREIPYCLVHEAGPV